MPTITGNKDPVAIGRRLKQARDAARLSQRELARREGQMTAAYISRLEVGQRTPTYDALRSFARVLGVTPEWLETGDGADYGATPIKVVVNLEGEDAPSLLGTFDYEDEHGIVYTDTLGGRHVAPADCAVVLTLVVPR